MVPTPSRRLFVPLAAALLALAACDDEPGGPKQVRENAFSWSGTVAPGQTLTVRSFAGGVEVKPGRDDTVRVVARLEWTKGSPDGKIRFSGSTSARGALICAIWEKGQCTEEDYSANLNLGRNDAKVYFTIEVPTGVKLDLVTLTGDITTASSAPVHAMTMNGDVLVATSVGPVQGESLNGSVDIRMSSFANTDSVIGKTINGEVFIYVPAVADATVDLGVMNGSVASNFAEAGIVAQGKKISGRVGNGARVIHGYALNGSVELRKLNADGTAP